MVEETPTERPIRRHVGFERIAVGVLAAIIFALGMLIWPQLPTLKSYSAESPRDTFYRPPACSFKVLTSGQNDRDTAYRHQLCSKELEDYRLKTNDLIQQTRAANASDAQVQVANQVLWLGFLQTLGGLLTLAAAVAAAFYAREAAKETKRSAVAAEDALRHSKSVSASQLRANIVYDRLSIKKTQEGHWKLEGTCRNHGDFSAFDFDMVIGHKIVNIPISQSEKPKLDKFTSSSVVSPSGKPCAYSLVQISAEDMKAIEDIKKALWCCLKYRYRPSQGAPFERGEQERVFVATDLLDGNPRIIETWMRKTERSGRSPRREKPNLAQGT